MEQDSQYVSEEELMNLPLRPIHREKSIEDEQDENAKKSITSSFEGEVNLNIIVSASTYAELSELAGGEYGIGEFLRNAISLSKWFNNTLKEGNKIYIKRKGRLHEVIKV